MQPSLNGFAFLSFVSLLLFQFPFSCPSFLLMVLLPTSRLLRHSPTHFIATSLFCISHRLSVGSSWQRSVGLFLGVSLPILSSLHSALLQMFYDHSFLWRKSCFTAPSGRAMCSSAAFQHGWKTKHITSEIKRRAKELMQSRSRPTPISFEWTCCSYPLEKSSLKLFSIAYIVWARSG